MIPEGSAASDGALEMVDLAGRLKLSRLQTVFALELAKHPKRSQTRAAIAAGASAKAAVVWASKTLRLGKVRQFLGEVREAAAERARGRARASPEARRVEEAIMESAEHQLQLSRIARTDIGKHLEIDQDGHIKVKIDPAYTDIIRELRVEERVNKDGTSVRRTTIRVTDPVLALQALARVRGWDRSDGGPDGPNPVWKEVLAELPPEVLRKAYLRMLQGGRGNGSNTAV